MEIRCRVNIGDIEHLRGEAIMKICGVQAMEEENLGKRRFRRGATNL